MKAKAVVIALVVMATLVQATPGNAIVNGDMAAPGVSDFVARVDISVDTNSDGVADQFGLCTGSLIHPLFVMTAHHCVDDRRANAVVRIGNQEAAKGIERRAITQILRHPLYNGGHNDIALLRLERPSYMRPIKLASPAFRSRWTTDPATDSVWGFATGWGNLNSAGTPATRIQRALVRLAASSPDAAGITRIMLDTSGSSGRGTCQGDSGGPLLLRADNDELRQVGVLKATGCPGGDSYSEVGAGGNRDWVRAQIPDIDSPPHPSQLESWSYVGGPTDRKFSYSPAATFRNGKKEVFTVGTDGQVYTQAPYGTSLTGWRSLGGYATSKPAVVASGPNRMDLFVRGGDSALYWKRYRDGAWQDGWTYLGGYLTSAPTVAAYPNGDLEVFVRGGDKAVYQKTYKNWLWSDWKYRGGQITSDPAAVTMGGTRFDVFARGTDNRLWQLVVDGDSGAWYGHDGVLSSGPAAASRGSGLLDVYVRGTDNALYHKAWDGYRWTSWDNRGGVLTSDPAAALGASEAVDVYARGTDYSLYEKVT